MPKIAKFFFWGGREKGIYRKLSPPAPNNAKTVTNAYGNWAANFYE